MLYFFECFHFYARSHNFKKQLLASACLSVCLSLYPHAVSRLLPDCFYKILFSKYYRKYVEKIQLWLKFIWNFTWRREHIYCILLNSSEEEKYFRKSCTEKQIIGRNSNSKCIYINEKCSDKKALQEKAVISFRLWALVTSTQTRFNINTHGKTW